MLMLKYRQRSADNLDIFPKSELMKSLMINFHKGLCSIVMLLGLHAYHNADAQTEGCFAGVFLNADDFIHDKLSYKIFPGEKGYKFNFNFPADMTLTLKIVTPDTTLKFPAGSIYGYQECGKTSRFFKGGRELSAQEDFYRVEQADEGFILYSSEFVSGEELFYSTDLTSPIHRLSIKGLRRDYRNNPDFLSNVKRLKRRPDGLITRNGGDYEIMQIYKKSKNS
jgi:hypothetical protein